MSRILYARGERVEANPPPGRGYAEILFRPLFTVKLLCTQATCIFVLRANCLYLTSDLLQQRCGHPWFTLYLLTIDPCSVSHKNQYSDC